MPSYSVSSSNFVGSKRIVLLIDHRDVNVTSIADALRAAGFRPHTLPNLARTRVHLAGPDPFEGLILPAELGVDALSDYLAAARELRPSLPAVILTSDAAPGAAHAEGAHPEARAATAVTLTASGFDPSLDEIFSEK